jgi:hypothetical protein
MSPQNKTDTIPGPFTSVALNNDIKEELGVVMDNEDRVKLETTVLFINEESLSHRNVTRK